MPRSFDHTIYVNVRTDPAGAKIYGVDPEEETVTELLGVSPCIIAVGLSWEERFGRKSWPRMSAWAPGNTCRTRYTIDKIHEIYFSCAAVKPGYSATNKEVQIAALEAPGFGWDIPRTWPDKAFVSFRLKAKSDTVAKQRPTAESMTTPKKASETPTVIVAKNAVPGAFEMGSVTVKANMEGARVYFDSQFAGEAPVRILTPPGEHKLIVMRKGYQSVKQTVTVSSASTSVVNAVFSPR
jgi:hypothetical protein